MTDAVFAGSTKPTQVPNGQRVQIGRQEVHPSHTLAVFKGLYFCTRCGYSGSEKVQKLSKECAPNADAPKRVLRLRQGKLPSGLKAWPNEQATKPGAMLQLG